MMIRHGFVFISKIRIKKIKTLRKKMRKWLASAPKKGDRAKNAVYNIPNLGKVSISKTGTFTIYTHNEVLMFDFFRKMLCKRDFKAFLDSLSCRQLGFHSKLYWDCDAALHITKPSNIPIRFHCGVCSNYTDFHIQIKVPLGTASLSIPSPRPNRKLYEFICKSESKSNFCET